MGVVPKEEDEDINRVDSIPSKCRADDTIRCRDGSRSICSVQQCDGVKDCDDGDDEDGCPHPGTDVVSRLRRRLLITAVLLHRLTVPPQVSNVPYLDNFRCPFARKKNPQFVRS